MRRLLLAVLLLAASASAQTVVYSHDFTGDANGSLPAGFTVLAGSASISGGKMVCTSQPCLVIYNAVTFSNDQYVKVKYAAFSSAGSLPKPAVRVTSSSTGFYNAGCGAGTGGICNTEKLYRGTSASGSGATTLQTMSSISYTYGTDVLMLKATGSTLSVWQNSTQLGTDSTDSTYTSGYPGVVMISTSASYAITYIEVGNLGNPTAATPTFTAPPKQIGDTITITPQSGCTGYTYWNTTGSPTISDNHGESITMGSATTTYYAKTIGCPSYADSLVGSQTYSIAATPSSSVVVGGHFVQQTIALSCSTGSSSIYYTTDGSTPTTGSTLYTGAFNSVASGSETVKALCIASGYGNSQIASFAYTIAPSDVSIISDNFSTYYDSNLGAARSATHQADFATIQYPLDEFWTSGHWKYVGSIPSSTNMTGGVSTSYPTPEIGGAGTNDQSLSQFVINRVKTGLSQNQFASVTIPSGNVGGAIINFSGDGTTKTGYYVQWVNVGIGGNGQLTFGEVDAGSLAPIVSNFSVTNSTLPVVVEFRRAGTVLQVLVNGSVPSGLANEYTPTNQLTGTSCGLFFKGNANPQMVSAFSCGNVGDADASSAYSYTPTYANVSSALNTFGATMAWPWQNGDLNYQLQSGAISTHAWGSVFVPLQISGSQYGMGLNTAGGSQYEYRAPFKANQWVRAKLWAEGCDSHLNNYFMLVNHQNWVPGLASGGSAAAGTLNSTFDQLSLYSGFQCYGGTSWAAKTATDFGSGNKDAYTFTPFDHVTYVTSSAPNTTDPNAANYCGGTRPSPDDGCNRVLSAGGSFYNALPGDEKYVGFKDGTINTYCTQGTTPTAWPSSTAVTVNQIFKDSNGFLERVIVAGTTGSSQPTWNAPGWISLMATPTITVTGGASGTYTYKTVAYYGTQVIASVSKSITNGPTTLDGTHYNTITPASYPGAQSCKIWRVSGGTTQGYIWSGSCGSAVTDNGLSGDGSGAPQTNYIGQATVDGTAVMMWSGQSCDAFPLNTHGTWHVVSSFTIPYTVLQGYPGLWQAVDYSAGQTLVPLFSDFQAGSDSDPLIDDVTVSTEQPKSWIPFF